MSGNTTNLGKQAQTGTLIADELRTSTAVVTSLTVTGNINAGSETVAGTLAANAISVTTDVAAATYTGTGLITGGSANILGNIGTVTLSSGSATITNTITAKSFSQPKQVVGSAASPSTTLTQAYSASFTKYMYFYPLTSGSAFNQIFTITGFPDAFFATNSAVYDATFVTTGQWNGGNIPISTADLYASETDNTLNVNVVTPVGAYPIFSGTAYIKIVISFSQD